MRLLTFQTEGGEIQIHFGRQSGGVQAAVTLLRDRGGRQVVHLEVLFIIENVVAALRIVEEHLLDRLDRTLEQHVQQQTEGDAQEVDCHRAEELEERDFER